MVFISSFQQKIQHPTVVIGGLFVQTVSVIRINIQLCTGDPTGQIPGCLRADHLIQFTADDEGRGLDGGEIFVAVMVDGGIRHDDKSLVGLRFGEGKDGCGGQTALFSRIVYTLVALAGVWCITLLFRRSMLASSDDL